MVYFLLHIFIECPACECEIIISVCMLWYHVNQINTLGSIVQHNVLLSTVAAQVPICNRDVGPCSVWIILKRFFFSSFLRLVLLHWSKRNWVGGEDNKPGVLPDCREWQQVCRTPLQTAGWRNRWEEPHVADIPLQTQRLQWVEFRGFWLRN